MLPYVTPTLLPQPFGDSGVEIVASDWSADLPDGLSSRANPAHAVVQQANFLNNIPSKDFWNQLPTLCNDGLHRHRTQNFIFFVSSQFLLLICFCIFALFPCLDCTLRRAGDQPDSSLAEACCVAECRHSIRPERWQANSAL